MIDFTGIDHGRLDKGGIAAIPGDPFACILSEHAELCLLFI
jgi:hypothetical protein